MRSVARVFVPVIIAALYGSACRQAPVLTNEVVAMSSASIPLDPEDRAWRDAPEHVAKLIPQEMVEPRLLKPSTPEVRVRAIASGSEIAFRLEWLDGDRNDLPGPAQFVDACAIQLPRTVERDPPAPQMGEKGRPVEFTFWRADWQASVDGRGDTLRDLYPHASVDHYPFDAQSLEKGSAAHKEMARRYNPAEALGNRRAGPREFPVENMVAEGPGTLSPAPSAGSKGSGVRTKDGWSVVLSRRAPAGLAPRERTQVAFAVWEGSQREVGSRKMHTGWIPLLVEGEK